jgi:uncharacterized membrane protein
MAESDTQSNVTDKVADVAGNGSSAPGGSSVMDTLKSKQVAIPLAASAVTAAAVFGARRGPSAVKGVASKVKDKGTETTSKVAEDAGKAGAKGAKEELKQSLPGAGILGKVASKVTGGGGGGGGEKKTRRLPIQRWTDVAVPVDEAYEKWTQWEEFPKFMHRVLSVEHEEGEGDEPETVKWEEKIWFSKRQWEAEITERSENDRIAWRTLSGTNHSGIVSFHRLDDNLTRVLVTVDFRPSGLFEKMGSGLRFAKRAVQADLARFKAYVELGREATGEEPEAREQREQREQEEQDGQGREETSARGDDGEERDRDESQEDEDRDAADRGPQASQDSDDEPGDDEARREREARRAERRERAGV